MSEQKNLKTCRVVCILRFSTGKQPVGWERDRRLTYKPSQTDDRKTKSSQPQQVAAAQIDC